MKAWSRIALCALFLLKASAVAAHGTHAWFEKPADEAEVFYQIALTLKTVTVSNHKYAHIKVIKEGEALPVWDALVEKEAGEFTVLVDILDWEQGSYEAQAMLLGEVIPHPITRRFLVRSPQSAAN